MTMKTTIRSTSWLSMDTSREALFDELIKIGEVAEKGEERHHGLKNALRYGAAGAAGVGAGMAAGYGVTELAPRLFKAKKPVYPRGSLPHKVVTIGLPIGAGLGATLWSKYRQKMHEKLHGTQAPNVGG